MQLVGMLDSPYVRRTAIGMHILGLPFEHRALSVFATFEEFQRINPLVKAPTLLCDDGGLLVDSTLILDYAQRLAGPRRSLLPEDAGQRLAALRVVGLALAACEKTVQVIYERQLRPVERHHQPWLDRVLGQLAAAFDALEAGIRARRPSMEPEAIGLDGITAAVAWTFTQQILPGTVEGRGHEALAGLTMEAEALGCFLAFPPDGPGVPGQA